MEKQLPYPSIYENAEEFVKALLSFMTSSDLLQTLCGRVHILDSLSREPDLYDSILPQDWGEWFRARETLDILDLLMREDIDCYLDRLKTSDTKNNGKGCFVTGQSNSIDAFREESLPPKSLLEYIKAVRTHTLDRSFETTREHKSLSKSVPLPMNISVGMKPKKAHEVQNFSVFVDNLTSYITKTSDQNVTHLVDLGAGQNYLGRALASPPYNKQVVAVESKHLNIAGAKSMDVTAKLAMKKKVLRNKKEYRASVAIAETNGLTSASEDYNVEKTSARSPMSGQDQALSQTASQHAKPDVCLAEHSEKIQYVEHRIQNGDLAFLEEYVLLQGPGRPNKGSQGSERDDKIENGKSTNATSDSVNLSKCSQSQPICTHNSGPRLMVISLHSCGNLLHHGLRSLVMNPSVKAVAMVGCCYNLVTERLGLPTYKHPTLHPPKLRADRPPVICDPHGFPMSERMATYGHKRGKGVGLNINSRMMAVQAPQNWTATECEAFFTRHFYRALLQRIFVDRNIMEKPFVDDDAIDSASPRGWSGGGQPIIIGSLRKAYYQSFVSYVRGAIAKISKDRTRGDFIAQKLAALTDVEIDEYEEKYKSKKKELSILWSLMAFSAGVVESVIVVDRWLYLKEQKDVKDCWVQTVFDYEQSPRNLVVVGIRR
ncbi:hypothetical protein MMC06_005059 [Schaereria dolodes]|nr:hypothetical protein [Schaereria dolodes]